MFNNAGELSCYALAYELAMGKDALFLLAVILV